MTRLPEPGDILLPCNPDGKIHAIHRDTNEKIAEADMAKVVINCGSAMAVAMWDPVDSDDYNMCYAQIDQLDHSTYVFRDEVVEEYVYDFSTVKPGDFVWITKNLNDGRKFSLSAYVEVVASSLGIFTTDRAYLDICPNNLTRDHTIKVRRIASEPKTHNPKPGDILKPKEGFDHIRARGHGVFIVDSLATSAIVSENGRYAVGEWSEEFPRSSSNTRHIEYRVPLSKIDFNTVRITKNGLQQTHQGKVA